MERKTIRLERIHHWPIVAIFGLTGLLAGMFSILVMLVLIGSDAMYANGTVELESGVLSVRLGSDWWPVLIYAWPVIAMLVHAAVAFVVVGFYNFCASAIAPISFTIGTSTDYGDE